MLCQQCVDVNESPLDVELLERGTGRVGVRVVTFEKIEVPTPLRERRRVHVLVVV